MIKEIVDSNESGVVFTYTCNKHMDYLLKLIESEKIIEDDNLHNIPYDTIGYIRKSKIKKSIVFISLSKTYNKYLIHHLPYNLAMSNLTKEIKVVDFSIMIRNENINELLY